MKKFQISSWIAISCLGMLSLNSSANAAPGCFISKETYSFTNASEVEKFCDDLVIKDGRIEYSDWRVPSKNYFHLHRNPYYIDEQDYQNIDECLTNNTDHIGSVAFISNTYSVPSRQKAQMSSKPLHEISTREDVYLFQYNGFDRLMSNPVEYNIMCIGR
ncbi:hypothetical protein NM22_17930 [Vibrio tubiashii]|nr:hypothetical protein NM22_17930 [Vibrio tubiashii]